MRSSKSETVEAPPLYTVKDVASATGLPQPVIAQLVDRTWTEDGWIYNAAQLRSAVEMAEGRRGCT